MSTVTPFPAVHTEGSLEDVDLSRLDTLIVIAEELNAADARIKEEILAAARSGDCDRVVQLVERWMVEPAVEVAAGLKG
jgi:hypothetical protein